MSDQETIYHITTRAQWEQAVRAGVYTCDSLDREGFIHCSFRAQVLRSARTYFRGLNELVVLEITPAMLQAALRLEKGLDSQQDFPHIYGPLNLTAVQRVIDFDPESPGAFHTP